MSRDECIEVVSALLLAAVLVVWALVAMGMRAGAVVEPQTAGSGPGVPASEERRASPPVVM